jgi:hypothetical protein
MTQVSTFVPRGWPQEYGQWVVGVYRHLQDKGQTGAPVYLNADEDDFNRIAILGSIRAGATSIVDFVETIKKTIKIDPQNPQQTFSLYNSMQLWHASKYPNELPPFLPLLLLSVLAAEQMKSDETFVSSNYYGRLANLIGYSHEHKDKVGISYRKYVAPLWNSFNEWLIQNPGVGLPTAFINVSQGFNDFVGVPVGQALLRSSEQEAIETDFFEKFFNSGGSKDIVDNEEFIENLDEWILSPGVSQHMKSIYRQAQDVLRINIWEMFERWQPRTSGAAASGRKAGLKLVLRMSSGLRGRTAHLSLNANFNSSTIESQFAELKINTGDGIAITVQPDHNIGTGTMIVIGNSLSDVLAGNTSLTIKKDQASYFSASRQPRAIIPFEVYAPGSWIETTQMKLGDTYSLITAAASLEHTMALLHKFGSGATVTSASGLPNQWKLVTGFIPTSSIGVPDNLPIQRVKGLQLSLINGLRLPGGSGIAEYPLTEQPGMLVLQTVDGKSPVLRIDGPEEFHQEYTNFDSIISPSFLHPGEYVVRLFESSKARNSVAYRRFILRDGVSPRHLPIVSDASLGVCFTSDSRVVAEFGTLNSQVAARVQGAHLVHGELLPHLSTFNPSEIPQKSFEGEDELQDQDEYMGQHMSELAQCVLNPYALHLRKIIDQVPGRRQRFQRWTCTHCGTSGYIDTRGRKKQEIKPKVLEKTELPDVDPSWLLEQDVESVGTSRETIEQRIWTLGGGGLREAASFSDLHDKNFVTQVLWSLAVSGHIDIAGMETDLCSGEWRTNPLTAVPMNGVFRLVGHRSVQTTSNLRNILSESGATLLSSAPVDRTYISELQIQCASAGIQEAIAAKLRDGSDDIVHIDTSVADNFLKALPPLSVLRNQLPTHPYMDSFRTTEYFDLTSGKWLSAQSVNLVGRIVRDAKFGTNYRFVVGGDPVAYEAIRCGYRLGKHLSAHWNRVALVGYDSEKNEITVPLGAELPLLYSRGVVYLTGSMPYRRNNQTIYGGASEKIFEQVKTLVSE